MLFDLNGMNQKVLPTITVVDNILTVDSSRRSDWQGAALNLEIMAPKKAMTDVMVTRGNVVVDNREGNVKLQSQRGDITVEAITGNAEIHMRNGDFNARRVSGDVTVEGRAGDITVADIGGSTSLQGDFFGGIDRKSTRLNSSHIQKSRMPSSA